MKQIFAVNPSLLRAKKFQDRFALWKIKTSVSAFRGISGLFAGLLLSACMGEHIANSLGQDLRVASVRVTVPKDSKHNAPKLSIGRAQSFPSPEIGLTRARVARDFTETATRVLVPASRSGSQPVNVQVEVYHLELRGTPRRPENATVVVGVMDVFDARTNASVVQEKWFVTAEDKNMTPVQRLASMGSDGNYIRSYDLIRQLFAEELRRQLVR